MKREFVNVFQSPERKKNLLLQVFPVAPNPLSSKTPISSSTKSHHLISENQSKFDYEKSYKKKRKISKQCHSKSPVKGESFNNNPHFATNTLTLSPPLIRPMYLSQVLKRTCKEPLTESYRLKITEANLKYLKSRFLDVNSRLSKILDLKGFDKDKRFSPESKKADFSFLRASARSINNEFDRERAEYGKRVNMKSRILFSKGLGPLYACK